MRLNYRTALAEDCDIMFQWGNDILTRKNAFNSNSIDYTEHINWYKNLNLNNVLIFFNENESAVGVVRIDKKANEWVITIMVDEAHRNNGYAYEMLKLSPNEFFRRNPFLDKIYAYIKDTNIASIKVFERANFILDSIIDINGIQCQKMYYTFNSHQSY